MKVKGVILAAGFGTRMGEYTKNLPKPMLPLNGTPMIEHTMRHLGAFGIKDIGLNLHYLADKISTHFDKQKIPGLNIHYVHEESPTGTAGGVKSLEGFLKDADHIIVIYGDIICDLDYSKFMDFHFSHGKMGTVCVHHRKKSNSIVEFDQAGKITKFLERPDEATLARYTDGFWVNSAIYCFKAEILNRISKDGVVDFPKNVFPALVEAGELFAYKLDANRYAIDSEDKYLEAEANFSRFNFKG